MRLEDVLHDVEALSAVEIGRLAGDHLNARRGGHCLDEPFAAIARRVGSGHAGKLDDASLAGDFFGDEVAGHLAARHVGGPGQELFRTVDLV